MSRLSHEEVAYQKVARLVVRYFYDEEEVLVMEVLLQAPRKAGAGDATHPTMQLDDVVAERLKLGTKQVRKHLSRMAQDRLVIKTRGGAKEAKKSAQGYDAKAVEGIAAGELTAQDVRYYWGVDYEVLVDAVHFKLDAMKRALDDKHKRANAEQQYACANCAAVVSALELTPEMMDFASGNFKCQAYGCGHDLDEVDNSKETSSIDAWRAELRSSLQQLHEAARDADAYEPPLFKMPPPELADGADGAAAGGGSSSRSGGSARGATGVGGGGLGGSMGPARAATAVAAVPHMMTTDQLEAHRAGLSAMAERDQLAREKAEQDAKTQAWQDAWLVQYQQQQQQREAAAVGGSASAGHAATAAAGAAVGAPPFAAGVAVAAGVGGVAADVAMEDEEDEEEEEEDGVHVESAQSLHSRSLHATPPRPFWRLAPPPTHPLPTLLLLRSTLRTAAREPEPPRDACRAAPQRRRQPWPHASPGHTPALAITMWIATAGGRGDCLRAGSACHLLCGARPARRRTWRTLRPAPSPPLSAWLTSHPLACGR